MSSGQPQQEQRSTADRVLGIDFFNGTAATAAESLRGCVVVTAAPALLKLNYDEPYRRAMQSADQVLLDSGLLARLWKIRTGTELAKISGIQYLRALLSSAAFGTGKGVLWVVGSAQAKQKSIEFLQRSGISVDNESVHILDQRSASGREHELLLLLEERRPPHVVIALRGGGQEELGVYLRDYLLYRPTIHCVGAALAFLNGDEQPIPDWAQRRQLGWLARLVAQPRMILPRLGIAVAVAAMVFRYGSELPPLRTRWTDL